MTKDSVEIIEKKTSFKDYIQVDHYLLKHVLHDGGWSKVISREVVERGHVAAALLYDPDLDLFVLIEQFRTAAFAARQSPWWGDDFSPWMVECVAGIIEDGESPEEMCRRESVEEANCPISDIYPISQYISSPGCMTETVFLFCGRVDASNAGGVFGLEEEGEDIRVFTATPEEAFEMLENGRIVNSMTILAVQWFQLNRNKLRHIWLGNAD
ncbi:MAG: NUDIX domain-containing protein [Rhodospirillales bacterium]|nr:NUDIX domain-containing protein [Rhodospirillales bacterium]